MTALSHPAIPEAPVRANHWRAILLLALVLFGGAAMRSVFGPLQEASKLDLSLSDFQMSLVQGLATGAPIAIFSIPIAWGIDHGNRLRLLIAMLGICVIGTIWTAFAYSLPSLMTARALAAVGAGAAISTIISLSADLCEPDRRGRAIVILGLGTYAGAATAVVLGGLLLAGLASHPLPILGALTPWRGTHLLIGLAGMVLLVPLFFLREPQRHEVEITSASIRVMAMAVWNKRRFLIPLFVGQIGVSMADTAAGVWATPVLIRDFHQQPFQFTGWMGGMLFVGGLVGSVLGGISADVGHQSGRRGGLLFAALAATALGIPAAMFPIMPTLGGFKLLFFLLLFSGTICSVVVSTAVTVLIPNEERGACMAAFGVINALIALTIAPTVVTFASTAMGGEKHLGQALAATGLITGLISFGGYILAVRNAPLSATEHGHFPLPGA